jgi:hypothetical protein
MSLSGILLHSHLLKTHVLDLLTEILVFTADVAQEKIACEGMPDATSGVDKELLKRGNGVHDPYTQERSGSALIGRATVLGGKPEELDCQDAYQNRHVPAAAGKDIFHGETIPGSQFSVESELTIDD